MLNVKGWKLKMTYIVFISKDFIRNAFKFNHNYNHTINGLCKFSLHFSKTDNYRQNMSIFIMFINTTPDFFLIRPHHIGILSIRSSIT